MTDQQPDDLEPTSPTRPRGHTLQDRLRRSAEQRVRNQARAHGDSATPAQDELQALLDLLNNGPSVAPEAPPPAAPQAPAPQAPPPAAPPQAPIVPRPPAPPTQQQAPPPPPPPPGQPAQPSMPYGLSDLSDLSDLRDPAQPGPVAPEVLPPANPQHPGTFTRETFTRETFTPAHGTPFVPSSDPRWGDEGDEAPPWEVPQARSIPAPGEPAPVPMVAPDEPTGAPDPDEARGRPLPVPLPPVPAPDEVDPDEDWDEWDDELEHEEVEPPGGLPAVRPMPAVREGSPPGVLERRRMRKDLRQAKRESRMAKRRYRILPRTVIGITAMLLVAAIAAGASGAVLYAYYDWRLTQNEDRVGDLAEGLEGRLEDANTAVENATNDAVADVRAEGDALRELIEDQNRIADLLPLISESVWYVSTLDDSGQSSVGSAFVVSGTDDGSLLLTSYATVSASTVDPAPEITLRKGDRTMVASLYAWDPARDLALLTVDEPNMGALVWANEEERAVAAGKRGYVATGLGGAEATISPGQVLDLTANEIQHNVAISEQYQGGPLLTSDGKVLGVASMEYNPLNFDSTGGVRFAVPIGLACEQVLTCNGDSPS